MMIRASAISSVPPTTLLDPGDFRPICLPYIMGERKNPSGVLAPLRSYRTPSRRKHVPALGVDWADATDHPGAEVFLDATSEVGSEVFRNLALNCWPWVRSLTHSPDAVTHSPAEITAA
jgi:hypothetical protein